MHKGRLIPEPLLRRVGRLAARLAPAALQRADHGRLLAADVGSGAAMDAHIEAVPSAQNVTAKKPAPVRIRNRLIPTLESFKELAADVHKCAPRADGVGRNDRAFDDLVGILFHQFSVLKGPRFPLVRVHTQVLDRRVRRHKGPLEPGRETGATAASQLGCLDDIDDLTRAKFQECLAQCPIAAVLEVDVDRV